MKISNLKKLKPKDLIVFDLDGTLTLTKSALDSQMADLFRQLLALKKVAVISGGKYKIFQTQLLHHLAVPKKLLQNLFLFPTTGTSFYRYEAGWKNVYALELSSSERKKIKTAFSAVLKNIGYEHPKKVYGRVVEDRRTQITFSALGQDVVALLGKRRGVALKERWLRENRDLKMKIVKGVARALPEFEVRAAGFTSIDVTKKGIDKAYGLEQMKSYLKVDIKDMLFIGDAIFPGGNDYAVVRTGVDFIPVTGPAETKKIIREILRS